MKVVSFPPIFLTHYILTALGALAWMCGAMLGQPGGWEGSDHSPGDTAGGSCLPESQRVTCGLRCGQ